MKLIRVLAAGLALLCASSSFAAEFPVQLRLFIGSTSATLSDLNQELKAQSLKEFTNVPMYGIEMTYSLPKLLEVGVNYSKRYFSTDETDANPNTDYNALLDQDSVLLVARLPLVSSGFVRLDLFGGVGGSNTTLTLKTASQNGELTRRESNDWFATLSARYGASLAFGYKNVYVVLEGGAETNKVDGFKRTGTINDNVQTIDLSGGYASIGLLLDGIPATSK